MFLRKSVPPGSNALISFAADPTVAAQLEAGAGIRASAPWRSRFRAMFKLNWLCFVSKFRYCASPVGLVE